MREFKFREWNGESMLYFSIDKPKFRAATSFSNVFSVAAYSQYIDVFDDYDQDIYEGDILKYGDEAFYTVYWDDDALQYRFKGINEKCKYFDDSIHDIFRLGEDAEF